MNTTMTLTDTDKRVLQAFFWENPCACGCAYAEMQTKNVDCEDCKFTKDMWATYHKIFGED